jgi:hypothetical protein
MSDRLEELLRQRAALEREIAAASAPPPAPPPSPEPPAAAASAPAPAAVPAETEALFAQLAAEEKAGLTFNKTGCIAIFSTAVLLAAGGFVALLYWIYR